MACLAQRSGAVLKVHSNNKGIGADWNAALFAANTQLVTIVHQDDVYEPSFASTVVNGHALHPGAVFSFCDADDILRDGSARKSPKNLRIKRLLVRGAFAGREVISSTLRKRILLGFGNPILCPTVTLNRSLAPQFSFREDLRTNMDWLAWITLSERLPILKLDGTLVHRRVHSESETSSCIDDGARLEEDEMVFLSLWPSTIARGLARMYRTSYSAYM